MTSSPRRSLAPTNLCREDDRKDLCRRDIARVSMKLRRLNPELVFFDGRIPHREADTPCAKWPMTLVMGTAALFWGTLALTLLE
jgi:hypothetical protein